MTVTAAAEAETAPQVFTCLTLKSKKLPVVFVRGEGGGGGPVGAGGTAIKDSLRHNGEINRLR